MAAKHTKIFYTSCMGAGSAEFCLIEGYTGQGIYHGQRLIANDEQVALYHEQLRQDNVDLPSGPHYITVMRGLVAEDVIGDNGTGCKVMVQALQSLLEGDYKKRKAVVNANLCYAGKDFAGRLDKVRGLLNGFDRTLIRDQLADTVLKHTGGGHRWYLDRHQAAMLREYSTRL